MFIDAEKEGYNVKPKRVFSEEHKKNLRLGQKGRTYKGVTASEESRLKMSLAKKGKKFSEEHKKNMSLVRIGGKHSEETKKKMSLAQMGHKHSEETKEKIRLANKGNIGAAKLTEEQAQYIIDNKGIIFQKDLAKELGVCKGTIENIHGNTAWTHLPRTKGIQNDK